MKNIRIAFLTALLSTALMLTTEANTREFADIYTECGLGAMIAPNNEVVAAITNVTWDLGTTAISSNASSEDSCKGSSAATAAIIYQTYPALEKDIANGTGEHLTALLHVAGVTDADHAAIIASLRPAFSEVVAVNGYANVERKDKAETLYNLLHSII